MKPRTLLLSVLLLLPIVALAKEASGLIPCGNTPPGGGPVPLDQQCDFIDLMKAIQGVLNFIIYQLATPIAVFMFAFAGFKLVTSEGSTSAKDLAKKIFTNTLIGYAVMLSAFLIMKLIFSMLFPDSFSLLS